MYFIQMTDLPERDSEGEKLKGLGHAILGNFSTDQRVIELPKI